VQLAAGNEHRDSFPLTNIASAGTKRLPRTTAPTITLDARLSFC
jgi:hypothetical protein